MGVSSGSGNFDLDAALAGGPAFQQRLTELASAKQSVLDAYTSLGLGNNAKLALEEAEKAKAEAASILANAKADANSIVTKAQEDAERMTAAARKAANDETNAAREQSVTQRTQAAELLAKANSEREDAAQKLKIASAKMEEAEKVFASVVEREAAAEKAAAIYASEADRLKSTREKFLAAIKLLDE